MTPDPRTPNRLVPALFFLASLLAFAAVAVTVARTGAVAWKYVAAGAAMAVLGAVFRRRGRPNGASA
ncbi:MAG TPA: hypothetical protein VKA84_27745 [Gemmatimonadaceae bacterium]|nr:hypothetical protein [Gemmatimonadaceae bacterium]